MIKMLGSTLTIITFSMLASHASAATIWEPTDENVNAIQIDMVGITLGTGVLALFEDTDITYANPLTLGSAGGVFAFTDTGSGNFTVGSYVSGIFQNSINMAGNEFVLAVNWGNGYVADSSFAPTGADITTFLIDFSDGSNSGQTLAVDLKQSFVGAPEVPVPAAAWLFGSAIIGLAGIKRRKKVSA